MENTDKKWWKSDPAKLKFFFLGFPLQSTMSRVSLQDPGVLNSPKTTLHSLLWLLSDKELRADNRELVELGYELIYKLCHNDETSGPALRYLRSSHDFIYRQLNDLELPQNEVILWKEQKWRFLVLNRITRTLINLNNVNNRRISFLYNLWNEWQILINFHIF